jgi:vancomycin resistance protein VanJ
VPTRRLQADATMEDSPPTPPTLAAADESGKPPRRRLSWFLGASTILDALLLAVLSLGNAAGPERWWWSTLNLYVPQWVWAILPLLLALVSLPVSRKWFLVNLLAAGWVAGPMMGLCLGWPQPAAAGTRLRVMTYNIQWSKFGSEKIAREVEVADPDLLLLQDSYDGLRAPLRETLKRYHWKQDGQFVVASRTPARDFRRPKLRLGEERTHPYLHCRLTVGGRSVSVYTLHLMTPRKGLNRARWSLFGDTAGLEQNARNRRAQARTVAAEVAADPDPVLLAGDLNSPPPSLVCRGFEALGLQDAFSAAGRGYGYTYGHALRTRHSFLRLDHVYVSREWRVLDCRTGGAAGSDHRPVIADLVLPDP